MFFVTFLLCVLGSQQAIATGEVSSSLKPVNTLGNTSQPFGDTSGCSGITVSGVSGGAELSEDGSFYDLFRIEDPQTVIIPSSSLACVNAFGFSYHGCAGSFVMGENSVTSQDQFTDFEVCGSFHMGDMSSVKLGQSASWYQAVSLDHYDLPNPVDITLDKNCSITLGDSSRWQAYGSVISDENTVVEVGHFASVYINATGKVNIGSNTVLLVSDYSSLFVNGTLQTVALYNEMRVTIGKRSQVSVPSGVFCLVTSSIEIASGTVQVWDQQMQSDAVKCAGSGTQAETELVNAAKVVKDMK